MPHKVVDHTKRWQRWTSCLETAACEWTARVYMHCHIFQQIIYTQGSLLTKYLMYVYKHTHTWLIAINLESRSIGSLWWKSLKQPTVCRWVEPKYAWSLLYSHASSSDYFKGTFSRLEPPMFGYKNYQPWNSNRILRESHPKMYKQFWKGLNNKQSLNHS